MSPEILAHVFEPFFSNSERGGYRLGMLIVKNIVEAHEGSITVASRKAKGRR
jgi:signal transduction histidine kinase